MYTIEFHCLRSHAAVQAVPPERYAENLRAIVHWLRTHTPGAPTRMHSAFTSPCRFALSATHAVARSKAWPRAGQAALTLRNARRKRMSVVTCVVPSGGAGERSLSTLKWGRAACSSAWMMCFRSGPLNNAMPAAHRYQLRPPSSRAALSASVRERFVPSARRRNRPTLLPPILQA